MGYQLGKEDEWWQEQDTCECPCHKGSDHCVVCTNDYSNYCDGRLALTTDNQSD